MNKTVITGELQIHNMIEKAVLNYNAELKLIIEELLENQKEKKQKDDAIDAYTTALNILNDKDIITSAINGKYHYVK